VAPLAAIILAHDDPAKVRRLLAALGGLEVLLHCDRRTPPHVFKEMVREAGPAVRVLPRLATTLASWSLVEAELRALRVWLETSRAEHVVVLSGGCYPLVPVSEICDELEAWSGRTRMLLNAFPYEPWGKRLNAGGGLWRVRRRFLTYRGQIVRVAGAPVPIFNREIPRSLALRASSQWKIYARPHAAALLRVLDEHPELVRFWRTTFVPDESCAASILSSPELVGAVCDEICDDLPWYLDWSQTARGGHPRWLTAGDLPALTAAGAAPRRPRERFVADRNGYRKLFARKIASSETALLDAIDERLRV
jgi:hypothetical protein